jgi:hypothetical protein
VSLIPKQGWRTPSLKLGWLPILVASLLILLLLWVPVASVVRMARQAPKMERLMSWSRQVSQQPLIQILAPAFALADNEIRIDTGIHIENIYDLSLRSKTYSADGRIWLEWSEDVQRILLSQNTQPVQLIDFVNQVEDWNGKLVPDVLEPVKRNGKWHQSFRFSQRFYLHTLDLRRYPFNTLALPITLQVTPAYSSLDGRKLFLLPIRNERGIIGEYANLEGYELISADVFSRVRTYRTDYGLMRMVKVSQLEEVLHFRHTFWPAFVSDVLPLAIVLLIVLISPYLEGSLGDVRIAIPSTALLTMVFLQQGYHSEVPPSPYLTYLDRLYAVSYLICVLLFVLFAWSSNVYERTPPEQREALVRRLDAYDQRFQLAAIAMLAAVSLEAWLY